MSEKENQAVTLEKLIQVQAQILKAIKQLADASQLHSKAINKLSAGIAINSNEIDKTVDALVKCAECGFMKDTPNHEEGCDND